MLVRSVPESLVLELFTLGRGEGGHAQQETERRKYEKTVCFGCSRSLHVGPVVRRRCCRPLSQSRRQGDLQSCEGYWQGRKSCREVPFLTSSRNTNIISGDDQNENQQSLYHRWFDHCFFPLLRARRSCGRVRPSHHNH